jgi:hypothetical protein
MSLPREVLADIESARTKLANAINLKTVADQEWGEWDLMLDVLAKLLEN